MRGSLAMYIRKIVSFSMWHADASSLGLHIFNFEVKVS